MIKAIVCLAADGGMGLDGKLLFNLPKDLAYFKEQTLNQTVVMGNNTYKSLPMFPEGLPKRDNVVLCSKESDCFMQENKEIPYRDYHCVTQRGTLVEVNDVLFSGTVDILDVWVIGGKSIYGLYEHLVEEWHITLVDSIVKADTYFQPDLTDFTLVHQECVSSASVKAQVGVYRRNKGE